MKKSIKSLGMFRISSFEIFRSLPSWVSQVPEGTNFLRLSREWLLLSTLLYFVQTYRLCKAGHSKHFVIWNGNQVSLNCRIPYIIT